MTVTIEATYQDGAFKSAEPVSLPEGARVRLLITSIGEKDILSTQGIIENNPLPGTAQTDDGGRPEPRFVWSKAIYRARKAAKEFTEETHADY
jgi:predicted DNA-binding antitoxin AbrB/MazE fold protein